MDQEVLRRRNAVFDAVYLNSAVVYSAFVPKSVRWCLEVFLLILAVVTLGVWIYVHYTYLVYPTDCLSQLAERPFPDDTILQVEVYTNSTDVWQERHRTLNAVSAHAVEDFDTCRPLHSHIDFNGFNYTLLEEYCDNLRFNITIVHLLCRMVLQYYSFLLTSGTLSSNVKDRRTLHVWDKSLQDGVTETINQTMAVRFQDLYDIRAAKRRIVMRNHSNDSLYDLLDLHCRLSTRHDCGHTYTAAESRRVAFDYAFLEFTQEPGYLSLTKSTRRKLNITTTKVYIDPENSACFGGYFGRLFTKFVTGYDLMIIFSFKNLLPKDREFGYIKDVLTGSHYYYKVQWLGKWRYVAGVLPTFFFTLVASVLSRQVHHHIFQFLTHFQLLLHHGIPMPVQIGAQIPFLIMTYAAIGLIIVMSEVLSDDSVFSLLMICTVWEVDQYYAIFCRHKSTKQYFPWFFYLYHFLPYAYYIGFNGHFWFIPFVFHWIVLQHAMLFFFHRCELPALLHTRNQANNNNVVIM